MDCYSIQQDKLYLGIEVTMFKISNSQTTISILLSKYDAKPTVLAD